ncbi:MAG TPA: Spy/CpxP family protein refolding chaperone [Myxococcales bacterium]|nr:Spy/CpxP family protein refolding chaperone [Myxococcales bacterium]
MYPGSMWWWRRARGGCGPGAEEGFGPAEAHFGGRHWAHGGHGGDSEGFGGGFGGGSFGVRRPLRFLAYKLELEEPQVTELARILSELKTERAQAAVDDRRAVGGLADAVTGESFDAAKAKAAADARVASAGKLRDAVVTALGKIHALLTPEQRKTLAYLIQTGTLSI